MNFTNNTPNYDKTKSYAKIVTNILYTCIDSYSLLVSNCPSFPIKDCKLSEEIKSYIREEVDYINSLSNIDQLFVKISKIIYTNILPDVCSQPLIRLKWGLHEEFSCNMNMRQFCNNPFDDSPFSMRYSPTIDLDVKVCGTDKQSIIPEGEML